MTKTEIIEQLYNTKEFNECINKMHPAELRQDLKAEVILVMCELDENKVIEMHQKKQLTFYAARVILNMAMSNTSQFYKTYRNANILEYKENEKQSITEIGEIREREVIELAQDLKKDNYKKAREGLSWYHNQLIDLYIEHGSYRLIEKETGIPFESIYKSMQTAIKQIRCAVMK